MDSKTQEYDGQSYVFNYGIGFLQRIVEALGMPINQLGDAFQANPFKAIPVMLQESLNMSHYLGDSDKEYTMAEVYKLIDKSGGISGEFVQGFLDGFNKSREEFTDPKKQGKQKPKAASKT